MIRSTISRRVRGVLALTAVAAAVVAYAVVADASTPPHEPFGYVDYIGQTPTGIQVSGWAIDPDTTGSIPVNLYINGTLVTHIMADQYRSDVAAAHPAFGGNHGFTANWTEPAGTYQVCLFVHQYGAGTTTGTTIGCKSMVISYDPRGNIAGLSQVPGGFVAQGWAADPSSPTTALQVNLLVDGSHTPTVVASQQRGDIARFIPSAGSLHGFTINVSAAEGTHHVCLYALNVGVGSNATIGCQDINLNFSPIGGMTALDQTPGGFHIAGWAFDPDTSAPVTVQITYDGTTLGSVLANGPSARFPGQGFDVTELAPGTAVAPGSHSICMVGLNLGTYGHTRTMSCATINLNYNPTATALTLTQRSPGALITGWARDPDTDHPVNVDITADGTKRATVYADRTGTVQSGHNFAGGVTLPNGTHTVCAIAVNEMYGSGNSAPSCMTVTLNFNPVGFLESVGRGSDGTSVVAKGWAIDPDTTGPLSIQMFIDGIEQKPWSSTGISRPDIAARYPGTGTNAGFQVTYPTTDQEHWICISVINVGGGTGNTSLNCRWLNAVHPTPPSAPTNVTAVPGYGSATVSWTKPTSDGGAQWTSYVVTASPSGIHTSVDANTTTATLTGLAQKTTYTFSVVAVNVAGNSPAGVSPAVTTLVGPPPQTTPAPISTSRYIRNITGATSSDLSWMHSAGAADATANPSGHRYLMLLDIGGQDQTRGGVLLSATTRFISYPNLVTDIQSYVDGYASGQRATAPATIAIGTNNDVDVSGTSGAQWASQVINPIRAYASKYPDITIAGANDIEPGFSGTYAATSNWVSGYLANTSAQWVNNGSADGCSWTVANSGCNNGWNMSGLYNLSMGAAPTRSVVLPQVYNNAMAGQWKYISLTGIGQGKPRINFGGPLTEWTACSQAGSCGSLTGNEAWTQMWNQLQSDAALKVSTLPFSTDLRIN